MTKTELIY